jgi:hypothetical protein
MATNMNRAVSTRRADPVSGSIPLRCSACEVRRIQAAPRQAGQPGGQARSERQGAEAVRAAP